MPTSLTPPAGRPGLCLRRHAAVLVVFSTLNAQTAPSPAPASATEEPVVLTPFSVNAANDKGYLAGSSLAGSRTATSLKDIGTPITAFTQQFLDDVAVTDTTALARYMVSTEYDGGDIAGPQNFVVNDAPTLRVRGLPGGKTAINFFSVDMRFDTFSLDRVDQSRGPNSILFGIGAAGGLMNVTTKEAQLSRTQTQLQLTGRSWHGLRTVIDHNQPIVPGRLALRLAAVNSEQETWRNWEYDDQRRWFATLKWQPDSLTRITAEVEAGLVNKAIKRSYTAYDAYTPWVAGGRVLSATANTALGVQGLGANPYVVFDTTAGTLQNWTGKTTSLQRSYGNIPIALADFGILPRETTVYGAGNDNITEYTRVMGSVSRTFFGHLAAELTAFQLRRHMLVYDPAPTPSLYLSVDTNATLPDGRANPNAGRPYFDNQQSIIDRFLPQDAVRLNLAYDFNLKWLGRHKLAGVGQIAHDEFNGVTSREYITNNPFNTAAPENTNNRVFRRTYVDLAGPSHNIVMPDWRRQPLHGLNVAGAGAAQSRAAVDVAFIPFNTSTQITSNTTSSVIGMLQSAFLHERLHTVFGVSQDRQETYASTLERLPAVAPFTTGVVYAKRGIDPSYFTANNVSFNGVFQLTKWLGLAYNQSINSALPAGGLLDTPNGLPPKPRGRSKDYGLKFDLLDHRVYATLTYFQTSANKNAAFNGVRAGDINPIWNALDAAGVLAASNLRLEKVLNQTTITTFDSVGEGIEFELIANLTDRWRWFANFSDSKIRQSNFGDEMRAYIAANRKFWEANGGVRLVSPVGSATNIAQYLVNVLDQAVITQLDLPDGGLQRGQARRAGNVRTNYEFASEGLKGVTVGGGVRYEGKAVTSYSATYDARSNTITRAALYRDPQAFLDLNLGYKRKARVFNRGVDWSVQLNVNNVLDRDTIVPLITTERGELVTYRFPTPREFIVSTRFTF